MYGYAIRSKHLKTSVFLFFSVMLFKFACELGYVSIIVRDKSTYTYDFNAFKYANGLLWCTILFWGIQHTRRRVSVFMLFLVYLAQIIPITTIYALGNKPMLYYNIVCFCFFLSEIVAQWDRNKPTLIRSQCISVLLIFALMLIVLILMIYIVRKNGRFSLTALNIYKVYELRRSGSFVMGKYWGYLFSWMMAVILPFFIAAELNKRNFMAAYLLCFSVFIIYLYCGHKSFLFAPFVIIVCSLLPKRWKMNFYSTFFMSVCLAFCCLVILACFSPYYHNLFEKIYQLFGRRLLMLSANNKFIYYDFFSKNPKMGFGGIFPRWIIDIPNFYENVNYTHLLSKLYYGKPDMGSNTGFLAEGYMRFGHIGILYGFLIFAWLLRLMDGMQKRAGYSFTVGAFVYPVLMLNDTHLIDTLLFGSWSVILLLLLFYTPHRFLKRKWKKSVKGENRIADEKFKI